MKFNKYDLLLIVAMLLWSFQISEGQTKITGSVFGNGGTTVSGSSNRIVGTVGQNVTGVSSGADNTSRAGFWYGSVNLITSVEQNENDLQPTEFRLEQNYPNPFNPTTTIRFAVPITSNVTIKIYDILGRQVTTLIDDEYQPGQYKVVFEAGQLASGLYIYRIQSGDFHATKKLILLK